MAIDFSKVVYIYTPDNQSVDKITRTSDNVVLWQKGAEKCYPTGFYFDYLGDIFAAPNSFKSIMHNYSYYRVTVTGGTFNVDYAKSTSIQVPWRFVTEMIGSGVIPQKIYNLGLKSTFTFNGNKTVTVSSGSSGWLPTSNLSTTYPWQYIGVYANSTIKSILSTTEFTDLFNNKIKVTLELSNRAI